jgi:hypothetical protein
MIFLTATDTPSVARPASNISQNQLRIVLTARIYGWKSKLIATKLVTIGPVEGVDAARREVREFWRLWKEFFPLERLYWSGRVVQSVDFVVDESWYKEYKPAIQHQFRPKELVRPLRVREQSAVGRRRRNDHFLRAVSALGLTFQIAEP